MDADGLHQNCAVCGPMNPEVVSSPKHFKVIISTSLPMAKSTMIVRTTPLMDQALRGSSTGACWPSQAPSCALSRSWSISNGVSDEDVLLRRVAGSTTTSQSLLSWDMGLVLPFRRQLRRGRIVFDTQGPVCAGGRPDAALVSMPVNVVKTVPQYRETVERSPADLRVRTSEARR